MSSQWLKRVANQAGARDRVGRPSAKVQVVQRLVGQHHAPAKGVEIRPVALDHDDPVDDGVLQLHQQAEIQAGRATANA
jgi:hypothetical protein